MNKRLTVGFCSGLIVGVSATVAAFSWTGVAAAPKGTSKVVLENNQVRVKDNTFVPGEKPGMHTHEYAHVGVIIDGGTLRFNYPDGKVETVELKRGDIGYREANVTHEVVNMSKSPIRVIEVEVK
jgi:quercetin dioxygenase-like cupin family protein